MKKHATTFAVAIVATLIGFCAIEAYKGSSGGQVVFDDFDFKIPPDPNPAPAPPVEPAPPKVDPVAAIDGKNREVSESLGKYAQEWADRMARTGQFHHRPLRPLTGDFGEVRENICWADSDDRWETAYTVWRGSPGHEYNRQHGGKLIGYGRTTAGRRTYFVVMYATKQP